MKKVNIEQWDRKHAYLLYSSFEDPVFSTTSRVDITALVKYCKNAKTRIYPAYLYASQKVTNNIREFKIRIIDGIPYEFETVHAAPTVPAPDHTFRFAIFKMKPSFQAFLSEFESKSEKALLFDGLDTSYPHRDTVYYTVIPWIHFTGLKNPNPTKKEDTPRIAFGKIQQEGDRFWMPVAIEANHGLMDGYHMGLYLEQFQALINNPKELLDA